MKLISYILTLIILVLLGMFIPGCESLPEQPGPPYNPFDTANPNYISPLATITAGPESGSTINSDEVTFRWSGNIENMVFRTKLDLKEWTAYSKTTTVTYIDLDEFEHVFRIQAQYPTGDTGNEVIIPFTVDAVEGPALMLLPRSIKVNVGAQFALELWVDETDPIAGVSSRISYDANRLRVNSVDFLEQDSVSFLLLNGGQLISFSEIDNVSGIVEMDCAVTEGSPRNVSGSGIIARIIFEHIADSTAEVTISEESIFRNNINNPVDINVFVESQIKINLN
jgi:hypothetical protein